MSPIQLPRMRRGTKPYKEQVEKTRALVTERTLYWSGVYDIAIGRISIRKQKTRWAPVFVKERSDLIQTPVCNH